MLHPGQSPRDCLTEATEHANNVCNLKLITFGFSKVRRKKKEEKKSSLENRIH